MPYTFKNQKTRKRLEGVYLEIYFWSIISTIILRYTNYIPFVTLNWGLFDIYIHLFLEIEPSHIYNRSSMVVLNLLEGLLGLDAALTALFLYPGSLLERARDNYAPWAVLINGDREYRPGDRKKILYTPLYGCSLEEIALFENSVKKITQQSNSS